MGLHPLPQLARCEVVLVWRDGSTTRAMVPVGADRCACGASMFAHRPDFATRDGLPVFTEDGDTLAQAIKTVPRRG